MAEYLVMHLANIDANETLAARTQVHNHDGTYEQVKSTGHNSESQGKTPMRSYRHAVRSGPWPWTDFNEPDLDTSAIMPPTFARPTTWQPWSDYPQNLFPNWTQNQVEQCKILSECAVQESRVFKVDMLSDGTFGDMESCRMAILDGKPAKDWFWELTSHERDESIRVRAIFVTNMTKELMQMLGTRYNIEPLFFSSSTNWIPSRYQDSLLQNESEKGDRDRSEEERFKLTDFKSPIIIAGRHDVSLNRCACNLILVVDEHGVDPKGSFSLNSCGRCIVQDLLSVHMIRTVKSSTIISHHPKQCQTTAKRLHSVVQRTGNSVYWLKIFNKSQDPTCLILCFLWYVVYAWDEAFENIYDHINHLEGICGTENIKESNNLHALSAHLLSYKTLLDELRNSVLFVQKTANPAMQDLATREEQISSRDILKQETDRLLSEIERLENQRSMQVLRLMNVMHLMLATVDMEDNRSRRDLVIAAIRESVAVRQILYLAMIFMPAKFMANVFCMNTVNINPEGKETIAHYIEGSVGLTLFVVWVTIAFQTKSKRGNSFLRRVMWPVFGILDVASWLANPKSNIRPR